MRARYIPTPLPRATTSLGSGQLLSSDLIPAESVMHEIRSAIHARLPWLGFTTRALLDALLLNSGSIGCADCVAHRLGMRNRFQLAKTLRANGLPPLHRLSAWMTVLGWVAGWEQAGASLSHSALRVGMEPAAGYRLVARVTGRSWSTVRSAGTPWVLSQFFRECGDGAIQKRRGGIPRRSVTALQR